MVLFEVFQYLLNVGSRLIGFTGKWCNTDKALSNFESVGICLRFVDSELGDKQLMIIARSTLVLLS